MSYHVLNLRVAITTLVKLLSCLFILLYHIVSCYSPKIDYFCHPMGLWSSLKGFVGLIEYTDNNEVFTVLQSERDPCREVHAK